VLGQRLIPARAEQAQANLQERARAIMEARPDLERSLGDRAVTASESSESCLICGLARANARQDVRFFS
jgi:hypothetical protein